MANIYFFGDNHGNFRHIVDVVVKDRPPAIVLLGDIEAQRPLEEELAPILGKTAIRFLHGNHDSDSQENWNHLFLSKLSHCNLHGRVENIAGVRIAGLGGVFRGKIWYPPAAPTFESFQDYRESLDLKHRTRDRSAIGDTQQQYAIREGQERQHTTTIFPDVYERLLYERADVLVTHEAPSCHPNGFKEIDELAQALGVRAVFHGHHHDRLDYRAAWRRIGFEAHGVGFCGCTDLFGGVVLPGNMDEARMTRQIKE